MPNRYITFSRKPTSRNNGKSRIAHRKSIVQVSDTTTDDMKYKNQ